MPFKQYLLNDDLAIAFAGVQEDFESICPEVFRCSNAQEVISIATDVQSKGLDFELLIGDASNKKIHTVKEGRTSDSMVGFIGDSEAFNAFQGYYHNYTQQDGAQNEVGRATLQILKIPEPVKENDIYSSMYLALKQVIWDVNIPSVGGVIVPLCTDQGRFQYLVYADVVSDILNIDNFRYEPTPIEFGTAQGGGYSVEFCDDSPYGGEGKNVGLYFLQGGFGVVFPTGENGFRTAELIKAKNPAYWVLETTKRLGHGIWTGYLSEDHCGIAGEELLKEGKEQDALFCYELRKDSKALIERPAVYDRYLAGYATAMFNCGMQDEAITILKTHIKTGMTSKRCKDMLGKMQGARGK